MKFVEIAADHGAAAPERFELVLAGGRTVRVPFGFDATELVRLVQVLEGARA